MKKTLAILLSLAMVFALFGAMTVSVSAEDYVTKTLYSFEDATIESGVTHTTFSVFKSSNTVAQDGTYSLAIVPGTAIWGLNGKNVDSSNYTNRIAFAIPEGLNITGNVGFYLYDTQGNSSNFDAYGVRMANGDMYFTKFTTHGGSANKWLNFKLTGTTMYKFGDTATTITPTAANFADDAAEDQHITKMIFVDGGTKDSNALSYIDKIYYQTTASSASPITMLDGAAMRIDGATEGIRFEAEVDKTAFDAATSGGTVTEIGTLIAKEGTDISNVVVDNAKEVTNNSTQLTGDQIPVAKYPSDAGLQEVAGTNKYIIVGSLVEIKDTNANQKYVARAYVKYTDAEGNPQVMYADALSSARSLAGVAYAIQTEAGENTYYKQLCEEHKAVVDGWAAKIA